MGGMAINNQHSSANLGYIIVPKTVRHSHTFEEGWTYYTKIVLIRLVQTNQFLLNQTSGSASAVKILLLGGTQIHSQ